ncbi:TRAP transporter small permease subunit [Prosthecomicrobium sp. N25]|uniref:TRAP transporter small permease subunit n=1 Tax=Prosthecomicrobium sp. N25 TaxID=3129254 RepID=UPI003076EB1A
MGAIADAIDAVNRRVGRVFAWASLALVLVQFTVVVMRYVFGIGSIWLQESLVYLFGLQFTLMAGATLLADGHVRVDILYRPAGPRARAAVDLAGSLLFLLPLAGVVLWTGLPYVTKSWAILEGSRETSGIPALFLLKSGILAFTVLTGLQGVSLAIRAVQALRGEAVGLARFGGDPAP